MTDPATPSALPQPSQRHVLLGCTILLITLATLTAYWPILGGDFSYWDDLKTIAQNPDLDPPTIAGLVKRWTTQHLHIYIPLTHTVWYVLACIGLSNEPNGWGTHVTPLPFKVASVGAHLLTSVLVFFILRRCVDQRTTWAATAGALLFALHPLQVESVGWTSGLKDLLFGLFAAACLLAYIGEDRDVVRPRGWRVALALVMLILAGLSKPTAMVVPGMLLAVDLLWLRRPAVESIVRLLPFVLIGGAFAVYARLVQGHHPVSEGIALAWRPLVAVDALGFYLAKLFVPVDLAFDYGRHSDRIVSEIHRAPLYLVGKAIIVTAAAVLAIACRSRLPLVTLGLVLALLPLAPVLGFVWFDFSAISVVADHYVYLSMLGIAVAVTGALNMSSLWHVRVMTTTAIVLVVLGVQTYRQSTTWRTPRAVTMQTLRVNPDSHSSWSNLALDDLRAGNVDDAYRHAQRALALRPSSPLAYWMLSNVADARGDADAAIAYAREAIAMDRYDADHWHRLAHLFARAGRPEEALAALKEALLLDPRHAKSHHLKRQTLEYLRFRGTTQPAPASAP